MNYVQDTLPLYIILEYEGGWAGTNILKFPINPAQLKKTRASSSNIQNIENIGDVSLTKIPSLAKISINSFFQEDFQGGSITPNVLYVSWLERWQKSGKPAYLTVTRFNYFMQVTCENFEHWINAGEDTSVYFNLDLQEYRPFSVKRMGYSQDSSHWGDKVRDFVDGILEYTPILVEVPTPMRFSSLFSAVSGIYTVGKIGSILERNKTLSAISKQIIGDSSRWKELYDENSTILGDIFNDNPDGIIPDGTVLTIPNSWINELQQRGFISP